MASSRACLCGAVNCAKHGRRSKPRRTGAYGGQYQSNRAVLLARWNADPNTACHLCGLRARVGDPWEPDHLIPVDHGGTDHISNLRPAHRRCNRTRGAQDGAAKRKRAADLKAQERIRATRAYLEAVR